MSYQLALNFNFKNKYLTSSDFTHKLHSYPCSFPASVPHAILKKYGKEGILICDPFVGSGTVLVEASLLGLDSIGVDINPIACLISRVKSSPIQPNELLKVDNYLDLFNKGYKEALFNNFNSIHLYSFPSINHWFQKNVIKELSYLKYVINSVKEEKLQDLFSATLSSIIVSVSNQESDIRYAAIEKNIKNGETINRFIKNAKEFKKALFDFWSYPHRKNVNVEVFLADTRNLKCIQKDSVDMIITSPPYANTYDYYLYHKHRMHWLDMDVAKAQYNEIGSRREFSSLKKSPRKWEEDITKCFLEMSRITKPEGKIFIIIGDSVINKQLIKADKLFKHVASKCGLHHIETKSTPLSEHSKRFNPFFRARDKEEHLMFFRNVVKK